MKLTIIRMESRVVTWELDNGSILDIAQRWFDKSIKVGNEIEFDINSKSDNY